MASTSSDTITEWVTVSKKDRRDKRMTRDRAINYQRSHNIKNLAKVLTSIETRNLEEDGWRFYCVLKGDASEDDLHKKEGVEYTYIPVPNEWQDKAYFCRPKGSLVDDG